MSAVFRNSSRKILIPTKPRSSAPSCRSNHSATSRSINDLISKTSSTSHEYLKACSSQTATQQIKTKPLVAQLYNYSQSFQYDLLLEAFLKWTSTEIGMNSLRKELSQDQISYFLGKIVKHQKYLIHEQANLNHSQLTMNRDMDSLKEYRYSIREVYSRLLFGSQSDETIYDRSKRKDLYRSDNLTTYKLTKMDYENLIMHELFNKKLDLASKWYKRYEQQFVSPEETSSTATEERISHQMWLDKFKVYSSGQPYTWEIPDSDIYVFIRKGYCKFKHLKHWKEVLEEYTNYCYNNPNIKSAEIPLLDDKFCQTLIYSAGHSKNTDFIVRFIEEMWGINAQGELIDSSAYPISRDDPRFPNLELLQAISIAFSYNRSFYQGMTYINAFQEHYESSSFDLSSRKAIPFWGSIIDWVEKLSRYNVDMALRHYLKTKSLDHLLKENTKSQRKHKMEHVSKLDLANDAEFDQEDFNEYIEGIKSDRFRSLDSLWKLYRTSNTHFSTKAFSLKLKILKEFKLEDELFEFLKATNEAHESYKAPEDMYFGEPSEGKEFSQYSKHICSLHLEGIKAIIEIKGEGGLLNQIGPLIDEWAFDQKMSKILRNWYSKKEPGYKMALEDRRQQIMVKQKSEKFEDEDEGLLDLF
ncbi:putative ATPase expression protein 2, mitochondrial [[Candida] railenensis]|uniref:ATPase expression protein 2, mitochondrial n=1 Tax=[Candida] railenensis TaxID=45579 RepID=A0A9P0QJZ6_9ASCO|nr:putative ATPase expression protein 2, mitochondrial [[Candida] railenensis]